MEINIERLIEDIDRYANFGKSPLGGVTRPSFSEEDLQVRELFISELLEMGLEITIDGAANIWGKLRGTGKKKGSIVIGSHLDSVPNGGKYDGPLGTLAAKEIVKTLLENNRHLDHDLEIVCFTAEESNDFHLSTFGSKAFVGKLPVQELQHVTDSKGNFLRDELIKAGGGLDNFPLMEKIKHQKKAFIELHIEQGQRLESQGFAFAIIDKVVGMYRSKVKVIGQANHSGTTMMEHRKDALTAGAEMILMVEHNCQMDGTDLVGTVGRLQVFPNATNIVPGEVEFTFEVRGESEEQIHAVVEKIQNNWKQISIEREVEIQEEVFLTQKPIDLDSELVRVLQSKAEEMGEPFTTLPSMAVHDAAHMAAITKSVMIFVKSIAGKSHCPEEFSSSEDIEKACNLLLKGILTLDRHLE